ncbi:hypothetical protein PybrP1_005523 [[Pythium] brassicae (nom. inval.)]|nr:hypothetical protein PybrP1_005523 [[Pythium] brassicae (nom. inval.)]
MARSAVAAAIVADTSGRTLMLVMDKFALSLACKTILGGKALAKNTISSYYGNVMNHYLDAFEGQRSVCEAKLAKTGTTLEKQCATKNPVLTTRHGMHAEGSPCAYNRNLQERGVREGLRRCSAAERAVGSLWPEFGYFLPPKVPTRSASRRMKTAAEQGLSLFKSRDTFASCVVHALAVASIMQATPSANILSFLPAPSTADRMEDGQAGLLDGWRQDEVPVLPSFAAFDPLVRSRVRALAHEQLRS